MIATNHALTGTAIGLIVGEPLLALPLSLLSHYICDALPHFAFTTTTDNSKKDRLMRSRLFRNYLIAEASLCLLIVAGLVMLQPSHWLLAAVCAFVAASPDLLSSRRYFTIVSKKKWKPGLYTRFAHKIQWFERPIGAVVEAAWLIAVIIILLPFLKSS
jgi:hypothetical protein